MWERDGERIYQNDTNYQFSQILVERTSSTYNNTLTINGTIEDVVGEYSCTVSNTLGSSNELIKTVKGIFNWLELSWRTYVLALSIQTCYNLCIILSID